MGDGHLDSASVVFNSVNGFECDNIQFDLPDRWCFGITHPYMQRLIFLAGAVEWDAEDLEVSD